jgi:hypothetical protein
MAKTLDNSLTNGHFKIQFELLSDVGLLRTKKYFKLQRYQTQRLRNAKLKTAQGRVVDFVGPNAGFSCWPALRKTICSGKIGWKLI